MHVVMTALMLAALSQLGDRNAGADAAAPADAQQPPASAAMAPAAPDVAAPAADADSAAETPQPTLADEAGAGQTAADSAAPANPFAGAASAADASGLAEAPAAETSVLVAGPKPAELMRTLLTPPQIGQLPGVPVTLGDAVRGATTRADQTERAQSYWNLSAAVTQYYLALRENSELALLRQGVAAPAAAWSEAAEDFARHEELARQLATAAQLRVHALMGNAAGVSLPLPADAPHCGRYNTRYGEIFIGREEPAASQLNFVLPLLQAELTSGARRVADATEWMTYVSEHREPANDGTGLLYAYELVVQRRRAFVEAAREFNNQIAAYTELAAPDQLGPDRLVAMLIRVSNPAGATSEAAVEPASAISEATKQNSIGSVADSAPSARSSGAKRTFARRPLDFLRLRERSIVTSRRLLRLPGRDRN